MYSEFKLLNTILDIIMSLDRFAHVAKILTTNQTSESHQENNYIPFGRIQHFLMSTRRVQFDQNRLHIAREKIHQVDNRQKPSIFTPRQPPDTATN